LLAAPGARFAWLRFHPAQYQLTKTCWRAQHPGFPHASACEPPAGAAPGLCTRVKLEWRRNNFSGYEFAMSRIDLIDVHLPQVPCNARAVLPRQWGAGRLQRRQRPARLHVAAATGHAGAPGPKPCPWAPASATFCPLPSSRRCVLEAVPALQLRRICW